METFKRKRKTFKYLKVISIYAIFAVRKRQNRTAPLTSFKWVKADLNNLNWESLD